MLIYGREGVSRFCGEVNGLGPISANSKKSVVDRFKCSNGRLFTTYYDQPNREAWRAHQEGPNDEREGGQGSDKTGGDTGLYRDVLTSSGSV